MSKHNKKGRDNGMDHIVPIKIWDFGHESDVVDIKFDSKNVRLFLGQKYKRNDEISYLVAQRFGTGEIPYLTAENLIQHHGRTQRDEKPSDVISPEPGYLALRISEFLCSKKVYEDVFRQSILDMRVEYSEAMELGRKEKAQWIKVRGYLWLIWTVALKIFEFMVSGPVKIIKSLWV